MLTAVIVAGSAGAGAIAAHEGAALAQQAPPEPVQAGSAAPAASGQEPIGAGPMLWLVLAGVPVVVFILWKIDAIRPGSLARSGVRALPQVPGGLWLAGAALVFLAVPLGASAVLAFAAAPESSGVAQSREVEARLHGLGVIGGYTLGVAVALGMVRLARVRLDPEGYLGWLGASWKDGWKGLAGIALVFPLVQASGIVSVALYEMYTREPVGPLAHTTLEAMREMPRNPWIWVQVAGAVVGAPIVEEVLYRLMLQTAVLRLTGSPAIAIVSASVVFGLSHVGAVEWYAIPTLVLLGMGLGVAFERCRSVAVPIVMHVVFNAVNVMMAAAV